MTDIRVLIVGTGGMANAHAEAYAELPGVSVVAGVDTNPERLEGEQLRLFIFWVNELGLGARSQARLLSSLRTFYKYLLLEGISSEGYTDI